MSGPNRVRELPASQGAAPGPSPTDQGKPPSVRRGRIPPELENERLDFPLPIFKFDGEAVSPTLVALIGGARVLARYIWAGFMPPLREEDLFGITFCHLYDRIADFEPPRRSRRGYSRQCITADLLHVSLPGIVIRQLGREPVCVTDEMKDAARLAGWSAETDRPRAVMIANRALRWMLDLRSPSQGLRLAYVRDVTEQPPEAVLTLDAQYRDARRINRHLIEEDFRAVARLLADGGETSIEHVEASTVTEGFCAGPRTDRSLLGSDDRGWAVVDRQGLRRRIRREERRGLPTHMTRVTLDEALCAPTDAESTVAGRHDAQALLNSLSLTKRERDLLVTLAIGTADSVTEAAADLGIAKSTARVMIHNIRKKNRARIAL